MTRPTPAPDSGVTLIEVMIAMVIAGILATMAVWGVSSWTLSHSHKGAGLQVSSVLRNTQIRAVSEGVSFCVRFNTAGDTYTVLRGACTDTPSPYSGPFRFDSAKVFLRNVDFIQPDGSHAAQVTFKPTGSASPGSLEVGRDGSSLLYRVKVEGFTGRVNVL